MDPCTILWTWSSNFIELVQVDMNHCTPLCEPKVPMVICTSANEFYVNLLHTYILTRGDCSWSKNPYTWQ